MAVGEVIILILIGIAIGICLKCIVDHSKEDRYSATLKKRYDERIATLNKDIQFWRDKCLINGCNRHEIDTYKAILSHLLDGPSATTDSIFMFEGKPYRPTSFDLSREEGRADNLTVEFVSTKFDI